MMSKERGEPIDFPRVAGERAGRDQSESQSTCISVTQCPQRIHDELERAAGVAGDVERICRPKGRVKIDVGRRRAIVGENGSKRRFGRSLWSESVGPCSSPLGGVDCKRRSRITSIPTECRSAQPSPGNSVHRAFRSARCVARIGAGRSRA